MIIIFNFIGAGIVIAGIVMQCVVTSTFGHRADALAVILAGIVLVALDLLYRTKREDASLLHPRRGGHISFIPVWILGLGTLAFGGYCVVTGTWNFEKLADSDSVQVVRAKTPQPGDEPAAPPRPAPQPVVFRHDDRTNIPAKPQPRYEIATPAPKPPQSLKLGMISGSGPNKLATINGKTFAVGETQTLKLAQKTVTVTCLEIRDDSVLAKLDGDSAPTELKFGKSTP